MNDRASREYDVIVHGATGFTGTLVAEYLLRQYGVGGNLSWAIAGRSAEKLGEVRAGLGDSAKDLDVFVADSFDAEALGLLASRTSVVLSTVGPYATYGSDLVAACVENGTHYCDLAGEVQWVRKMIDLHQASAERSGTRIVHCCGFDSVPMDIGVWFLQDYAQSTFGLYCESISLFVKATKGAASGGTLASMLNLIKESREDRSIARTLVHPYSLNPAAAQSGADSRDQQTAKFRDDAKSWTAPFVMAAVNTKVVRRSHALAGFPYGQNFRYDESIMTGAGISGWFKATAVTVGLAAFVTAASFGPSRQLMQKFFLTKPGDGPDRELQKNGFFNLLQIGVLSDGRQIRTCITGDQDPGYGSTSKMLSECAVCLAKDKLASTGGVLTPATAMARPLLERLRSNAGLTFDVLPQ